MNIANWLYQSALNWPGKPAILLGIDEIHNYGGLLRAICCRARHLTTHHKVGRGDRVAIFAKNSPEYIEIMHACWWIGAVAVPVNSKLHPIEVEWILENSRATLVYTDNGRTFEGRPGITEAAIDEDCSNEFEITPPVEVNEADLAWLFYTSGTTGRPKGVMLSHGNLREMALCYAMDVVPPCGDDVMLYAAPISHGAGLYMFAVLRVAGAHLVPVSRGFDPGEIINLARTRGNLVFFAAPTMVKRLIAAAGALGYKGEGIRSIIYGGGPMYANDIDEAVSLFGSRFVQIYGQGESPMTITALSRELVADETHPAWRTRRASVGVAQASVEVQIRDKDDKVCPIGCTGEIVVRGPSVMKGYWEDPEASARTLAGGWLRTGDLGHLDQDGFLYLTDRSKDVIISGGTNIYPREVEEVLLQHPAVFEVAVIGVPDSEWGENVTAHVVLEPGQTATVSQLDHWCRQFMAAFKRPKHYVFAGDLPKNSYGKILKTELRKLAPGG
ncbi:class I adenylate-forming enzyme family protein [Brucella cytisi]|uniref:class I adenylate-forming enzyme family protein n=1 Tax=Brucella cytisi TaxID=407152 RepID=UPI00313F37D3